MVHGQLSRIHKGEMEASAGWLRNVHPRIIPSPSHEAHSLVQNQDATTSLNENLNSNYCAVQFINMLLNIDHVSRRAIIIKLVSHNDICTCIEEVISSKSIESQATFNKAPVKWEDCVPPYAVDEHAFMNHTRGAKKGLPRDPNPSVHTVGKQMATSRAKGRVMNSIKRVGTKV
jgi:hypothetical protein